MPYIDQIVLVTVALATGVTCAWLWQSGLRRLRLAVAAWLAFYGIALVVTMTAHSADIVYGYLGGVRFDGSPWTYEFRTYALHLLGAVLVWQGVKVLSAVAAMRRGRPSAGRSAAAAAVTLAVTAPLIPIHAFFAVPLSAFSLVSLLLLAVARPRVAAEERLGATSGRRQARVPV